MSFYREVTKKLKEEGWYKLREGKGSHEIWDHPNKAGLKISVPKKLKKRHTANGILKQAGINQKV